MRGGRQVRPGRLEGVYAFRPRAHQDRVRTVLAAFGVADRESVNRDCFRVNQRAHGYALSGANIVYCWFDILCEVATEWLLDVSPSGFALQRLHVSNEDGSSVTSHGPTRSPNSIRL